MQKISKSIATLFFVGFSPIAPGTVASLLAIVVYLLVKDNIFIYFFLTMFLLILGFWSANRARKDFPDKDPAQIVIDEFSSMLLVYFFIPFNPKFLIIGLILFRFFDISKIPPLKRLEELPAGFGIMLDDIAAAVLANLVLQVLRFFPAFS
ncbi:MAG: phosphatidylglycerophosphatase A [Candidatus Omnitrophota bacterium]|nr:MAG: phosphatidylglycerophosphatase A [Candidatus Omnitrophota bacterium]